MAVNETLKRVWVGILFGARNVFAYSLGYLALFGAVLIVWSLYGAHQGEVPTWLGVSLAWWGLAAIAGYATFIWNLLSSTLDSLQVPPGLYTEARTAGAKIERFDTYGQYLVAAIEHELPSIYRPRAW